MRGLKKPAKASTATADSKLSGEQKKTLPKKTLKPAAGTKPVISPSGRSTGRKPLASPAARAPARGRTMTAGPARSTARIQADKIQGR